MAHPDVVIETAVELAETLISIKGALSQSGPMDRLKAAKYIRKQARRLL